MFKFNLPYLLISTGNKKFQKISIAENGREKKKKKKKKKQFLRLIIFLACPFVFKY